MIYCVEDDDAIRELMIYSLKTAGFEARGFADAEAFWPVIEQELPDLVLLDVMMPGQDGISILQQLRSQSYTRDLPVVMATARGTEIDKVQSLDLGADDYLVKPFAFSELSARVQVLLRRAHGAKDAGEPTVLGIADLELDLIRRKATRGGHRLELTAKEFLLLALFLRRKGEVLSRTEIAEQVWDMNFDSDTNVVEVAIRRLRTKMDLPFDKTLLHTVRGMGYVMEERES